MMYCVKLCAKCCQKSIFQFSIVKYRYDFIESEKSPFEEEKEAFSRVVKGRIITSNVFKLFSNISQHCLSGLSLKLFMIVIEILVIHQLSTGHKWWKNYRFI